MEQYEMISLILLVLCVSFAIAAAVFFFAFRVPYLFSVLSGIGMRRGVRRIKRETVVAERAVTPSARLRGGETALLRGMVKDAPQTTLLPAQETDAVYETPQTTVLNEVLTEESEDMIAEDDDGI